MNHATRFTKLALLLIVAGALALAGCGGDDGVAQSVHDQALAAQAEAEAAAETAAAAATAAEAEAETATAAEAAAETAAAAAAAAEEEARMEAAAAAAAEEEARMEAAAAAAAEEEARMEAAAAAAAEEEARMEAAAAAAAEEEARMEAAAAAAAAAAEEEARMAAEAAAAAAEEARMAVEAAAAAALMAEQDKASEAMDAAKMAADAAKMASDEAAMATMSLATMQTGAMSATYAYNAKKYADMAMAEYMKAKTASDAAMDAEDTATAALEASAAEAAQIAAEAAAEMVANADMDGYADKAKAAAMMELMIDGTMKSVGDTTIDAMAGASSVTTGTGAAAETVMTGLIESKNPMATGEAIDGAVFAQGAQDDLGTALDESTPDTPYKQAAAIRTFAIGKTLDSPDDMTRLMLIDSFAGEVMVKIFSPGDGSATVMGTKAGYLTIDDRDAATIDTHNTALRSLGMFYPVSGDTAGTLAATDTVASDAEPTEVFSYVPPTGAAGAGVTQYATLTSTTTANAMTTSTYASGADITGITGVDGPDAGTNADESQIISGIPGAVAYEHLHFGVWAGLGDAAKDGTQKVDELGIGFVQNFSGMGMTADMPITGTATYDGDWGATIQAAAGGVTLENGTAVLTADFVKSTLKADLDGLAMLEGALDGSTFKGTKATVGANNHGLTSGGTFSGTFSGGFYGENAVEAGGIFDFSSTNAGAFVGALGGRNMAADAQ